MQRATLGKSGSEAASQLQGRIARAFYSNSLVNTMDMTTAAIEYILTAAQSLGSQDYYRKSRMTILGLAGVLTSRHRQNGLSYVPKKIFIWMRREARGGLKATVGNRVKPDYHFIRIVFVIFCFFQPDFCVPLQTMLKACRDIVGLSQTEV